MNALITYSWNGTPAYVRNPMLVDMEYFFNLDNIWGNEEASTTTIDQ